mmetsp:Transcript_19372/g.41221  ORF Transcript_19372/g.41221 Transcript_19372/m.41221 type:complete len:558 (-) Transcript_19372:47-1720(-)
MAPPKKDEAGSKDGAKVEKRDTTMKKSTMRAPKNHPQLLHLVQQDKPAVSLEAWFDGGLMKARASEDEEVDEDEVEIFVRGQKLLPPGYRGCTKDCVLAEADRNGIRVWPIRFDVGEISADTKPPWTLYHYTHRHSFEEFMKLFQDTDAMQDPQYVTRMMLSQLTADYQDRQPKATPQNPKQEPELMLIEPSRFEGKEEILHGLFGSKQINGFSSHGNRVDSFADFCIAVRVPASACLALQGEQDKQMVKLCRETLEALYKRSEAKRLAAVEKAQKEEERKAKLEAERKAKRRGCFSFFCCSGGQEPIDWDEVDKARKKKQDGEERLDREKRHIDHGKNQLFLQWTKEHFVKVQGRKKKEIDDKKAEIKQEANRRAAEAAAKAEAAKTATAAKNKGPGHCKIKVSSKDAKKGEVNADEDKTNEGKKQGMLAKIVETSEAAEDTLALYKGFRKSRKEQGDVAQASLTRLKMRRAVNIAKLAAAATEHDDGLGIEARMSSKNSAGGLRDSSGSKEPPSRNGSKEAPAAKEAKSTKGGLKATRELLDSAEKELKAEGKRA